MAAQIPLPIPPTSKANHPSSTPDSAYDVPSSARPRSGLVELTVPVVTVVTGSVLTLDIVVILVVILDVCLSKILCFFDGARFELLFHIANDGLPAIIYVNVFDAHELLTAITQPSKDFYLKRESLHQTRRS